ncbi:MAG TPA: CHRD domain-containing protein [Pyrinomonadaceae bacterium]|nr:CHRD domain-containing protein [Pyrinomonadaceae bacterium]
MKRIFNLFAPAVFFGVLCLATAVVRAEISFTATLSGAQEVPPTTSSAKGFGIVTLNDAETQIRFSLTFSGLGSNQTASHIHGPAAIGANAPVLFNIGSTGATGGTFTALTQDVTPAQAQQLKNGLWYFNVHSSSFPNGEIRGQILPASPFIANLSGLQEVPSNNSAGTGIGKVFLNATEDQMVASLNFSNLGSSQTASHIHGSSLPGANSPVLFNIGSQGATSGSFPDLFFAVTPQQVANLKAGLFYFNVHSAALPGGEIRGQIKPANKPLDFDGDSRSELALYNGSSWILISSINRVVTSTRWGTLNDVLAPGDFDLDGKIDLNVWRNGTFYTLRSSDNSFFALQFGTAGDDPRACADYDGDGKADYAVYRPGASTASQSFYYIQGSLRGFMGGQFGLGGDSSMLADWDGDRISDVTVYRQSTGTFYGVRSTNQSLYAQQWGDFTRDRVMTGDIDGDGKSDPIVFRRTGAEAGWWYALGSGSQAFVAAKFGIGTDTPVPADFDGDNRTDLAVYRQAQGAAWYISGSTGAFFEYFSPGGAAIHTYQVR